MAAGAAPPPVGTMNTGSGTHEYLPDMAIQLPVRPQWGHPARRAAEPVHYGGRVQPQSAAGCKAAAADGGKAVASKGYVASPCHLCGQGPWSARRAQLAWANICLLPGGVGREPAAMRALQALAAAVQWHSRNTPVPCAAALSHLPAPQPALSCTCAAPGPVGDCATDDDEQPLRRRPESTWPRRGAWQQTQQQQKGEVFTGLLAAAVAAATAGPGAGGGKAAASSKPSRRGSAGAGRCALHHNTDGRAPPAQQAMRRRLSG